MTSRRLNLKKPSRADTILMIVAVAFIALPLFFLYSNVQASTEVDDLTTRISRASVNLRNAQNDSNVEKEKAQKADLQAQIAEVTPPLFDGGEVMLDLWQWARQHNVEISTSSISDFDDTLGEQLYKVSDISLVLTGKLVDLAAFITTVASAPIEPVLNSVQLRFSEERNEWALDMEMSLYQELEGGTEDSETQKA